MVKNKNDKKNAIPRSTGYVTVLGLLGDSGSITSGYICRQSIQKPNMFMGISYYFPI